MISASFRTIDGSKCTIPGKCSIIFDKNSSFQYFPSNATHFILNLSGTFDISYHDGSVVTSSPIYTSNNWTNYQELWRYDVPFTSFVTKDTVLVCINIANSSLLTSQCTLKVKTIENETYSFSTDKQSTLFVYGLNYNYNDELQSPDKNSKLKVFANALGNTKTHKIDATTPVSLIFLEKI
jgi:hypothetical protein